MAEEWGSARVILKADLTIRVVGQEVQAEHIKVYICKPSASVGKSVIVIHDIFGWQLPNTRYMADMLTTNGYM